MNLEQDENVLWKGFPKQGIVFSGKDVFLVPFSIMWGGFAIFWEMTVLRTPAPSFFILWGIPFVIVGIYFILGRFVHDYLVRKNTEYLVTNKRVIIKKFRTIESIPMGKWSSLKLVEFADNSGTILFADPPNTFSRSRSMSYWLASDLGVPAFFKVDGARGVMKILNS